MKSFKEFIREKYTDYDGGIIIFPYVGIKSKATNLKIKAKMKGLVKKYNGSIKGINKYDVESKKITDYKYIKNKNTKLGDEFNKSSLVVEMPDVNYDVFKNFCEFVKGELSIEGEIAVVHNTMKSPAFI